jgi:hypothetical protein
MMWRCVGDSFGYCATVPQWQVEPEPQMAGRAGGVIDTGGVTGGRCKNDPKTCLFYRSNSQVTPPQKTKRRRAKKPVEPVA